MVGEVPTSVVSPSPPPALIFATRWCLCWLQVSAALRDNNSGTVIFFDVPVHLEAFFVEAAPMDRNLFVTTFKSLPDTAEVSNTVRPVCLCGKRLACCVGLCHGMGYAVCACNVCSATQPFTFIVGGLVPLDPRTAGIVFNRAFFL